ncbi:helix-turn-helix domain-containing protein [Paenibacillus taichungensis]|uniref:Helix-turn-helix domain-containing protein n=1 Tax=Paenibacillus taichungensis TaxID=484184 RepID=A0ABX2MFE5_9BACL|nr:helix-turn-helix domain-containing protein [Paenibacillus taichungensis]NUU52631.1 helix-turn-helix domain-containing protein [Paenibacillus taichungensis]
MTFTLKQARLLSGFTQAQVAKELDVHRHTYIKWERNADDMPIGKAKKASELFGKGVDEIFFTHESTLSR